MREKIARKGGEIAGISFHIVSKNYLKMYLGSALIDQISQTCAKVTNYQTKVAKNNVWQGYPHELVQLCENAHAL